jgi:hypothetical protein
MLTEMRGMLEGDGIQAKRVLLKRFVERVEVSKESLKLIYTFPVSDTVINNGIPWGYLFVIGLAWPNTDASPTGWGFCFWVKKSIPRATRHPFSDLAMTSVIASSAAGHGDRHEVMIDDTMARAVYLVK